MPFRARHAIAAAVLVSALAATSACSGNDAVTQTVAGSSGYQAGDDALTWLPAGERSRVGTVTGELLDGRHFDLASWRGKVVVVNFWGSWCHPCREEAQALDQVYRDNRSRGVEFLGVDVREDRASAQAFIADRHIAYPSLFDPDDVLALRFPGLPPNATPTTLVIDREGRIAARNSGEIHYTTLRDVVAKALAEKT